jgi:adenylylsulfate kinase
MILLLCGLSGAGKSTLAQNVKARLNRASVPVEIIDGDTYRDHLCTDLGFSRADRCENLRRLGFVADRFAAHGIVAIISAISPYEEARRELAQRYRNVRVAYVDCALDELRRRDTKGLYRRAALPDEAPDKLRGLSGVSDPFEPPVEPDLYFDTQRSSIDDCTARICDYVLNQTSVARRRRA